MKLRRILIDYEDAPSICIEPHDIQKMLGARESLETLNQAVQIAKQLSALYEAQ